MSNVFLVVEPGKIRFLVRILYPKGRIESYSIIGTIVSSNKIPLKCPKTAFCEVYLPISAACLQPCWKLPCWQLMGLITTGRLARPATV